MGSDVRPAPRNWAATRSSAPPLPPRSSTEQADSCQAEAEEDAGTDEIVAVNDPRPPVSGVTWPDEATAKLWPPPLGSRPARKTPPVPIVKPPALNRKSTTPKVGPTGTVA